MENKHILGIFALVIIVVLAAGIVSAHSSWKFYKGDMHKSMKSSDHKGWGDWYDGTHMKEGHAQMRSAMKKVHETGNWSGVKALKSEYEGCSRKMSKFHKDLTE